MVFFRFLLGNYQRTNSKNARKDDFYYKHLFLSTAIAGFRYWFNTAHLRLKILNLIAYIFNIFSG